MRRALGFAALLGTLYGVLYVLLQLEDLALLMGSLLLFAILSAVMVLTRKVDWYQIGRGAQPSSPPEFELCQRRRELRTNWPVWNSRRERGLCRVREGRH